MEQAADASEREPWRRFHLPAPHLPHGLVTFPRRLLPWIEPWFLAYACLGVVQAGMLAALAALLFMPTELGLPLKTMFAAVFGVGFAAANTAANMFIVEVRPP